MFTAAYVVICFGFLSSFFLWTKIRCTVTDDSSTPSAALAYSASSVAQGCVVTDDGTSIWIPPSPLSVAQGCVITDDGTSILITKIKHDQTYIVECDVNLPLPDLFCTIHNAPVNVTITGEEPFTIFPEGCWRVRNEHVCKVANCYPDSEATIHVISPSVRNKED